MELFVHRSGGERIELRTVEESVTVAEAVSLGDGETVWLEESEEVVDVELTASEAGIKHRGHVHANRCHRAAVTVNFNGATHEKSFAPSTTIRRVFAWATGKDALNLSETDRLEHTLQLCGTTTQPDDSDHLGSFVNDACQVCFDLVPKHRFEG